MPLNFYMDDSGTRSPNQNPLPYNKNVREFFALGGVLISEEDEAAVRRLYREFFARWSINYPLHSVEIRHRRDPFSWLNRDRSERDKFMSDLTRTLLFARYAGVGVCRRSSRLRCPLSRAVRPPPVAPVSDRVFHRRGTRGQVCAKHGRKLRVMPERSNKIDDERLTRYYDDLRNSGPPFAGSSSAHYSPLTASEFRETLHEIRFKTKSSPMAQVADLYLWPIAIAGYEPENRPYVALRASGRLIENRLSARQIEAGGSKYSCFELVRRHRRGG